MATLSPTFTNHSKDTQRSVSSGHVYTSGFIDRIKADCVGDGQLTIPHYNSKNSLLHHACQTCNKNFSKARHLRWHMRNVHRCPLQCRDCQKIFPDSKSLSKHRKRWHQVLSCPFCPEVFNKIFINVLDEHVTVVHRIKPHTKLDARNYKTLPSDRNQCCCSMRFKTLIELDNHRAYECKYKGPPLYCCKDRSWYHSCCTIQP